MRASRPRRERTCATCSLMGTDGRTDASVDRLSSLPWQGLAGLGPLLAPALDEVLQGTAAERVLDRTLRANKDFTNVQRAAVAEAIFGVGLWRRRLLFGQDSPTPLQLLGLLLRDLAGRTDALTLLGLESLPAPSAQPTSIGMRYSLPDWLAETVARELGADAALFADALNLPGPICLRANTLRTTREALAERLAQEGVETRPCAYASHGLTVTSHRPNLYGLESWSRGLFEVQDEGSQLIGELCAVRAGDTVLDLCAGAGGKTLQLAALTAGEGVVHAYDTDPSRLERLRIRAQKAGATNVRIHHQPPGDALKVDVVLVDAPCSELGALRRGPDLRFRIEPATFEFMPPLQRTLLEQALGSLKPHGRLVYATCTIRREENEDVARAFEVAHPTVQRLTPGVESSLLTADGFVRTWPHKHGTDGFFASVYGLR